MVCNRKSQHKVDDLGERLGCAMSTKLEQQYSVFGVSAGAERRRVGELFGSLEPSTLKMIGSSIIFITLWQTNIAIENGDL